MATDLNSAKKRKPTADDFLTLTPAQLRDLANDLDDRIGDMRIDEEQICEEAGYDKLASMRRYASREGAPC